MRPRILAVDDDAAVLELLESMLRHLDCEVLAYSDSQEAARSVARHAFDGAFIDGHMPHVDGLALARVIRRSTDNGSVPIVLITADPDVRAAPRGQGARVSAVLKKPFDLDTLDNALVAIGIRERGQARASEQAPTDGTAPGLTRASDGRSGDDRLRRDMRAREVLVHAIVHDLSQPLTAMRAALSLAGRQKLPPRVKSAVKTAMDQAERQSRMLEEVLAAFLCDLQSDATETADLAECAWSVVRALRHEFERRGVRIGLDATLDVTQGWRVQGDRSGLIRVFGNLAENALRHSARGATVTLSVHDDGAWVEGAVTDQGPGVPDGMRARLFGAPASTGAKGRGKAGLGLYFCRLAIERWGGRIGCESPAEGGARFWFRLPRRESQFSSTQFAEVSS